MYVFKEESPEGLGRKSKPPCQFYAFFLPSILDCETRASSKITLVEALGGCGVKARRNVPVSIAFLTLMLHYSQPIWLVSYILHLPGGLCALMLLHSLQAGGLGKRPSVGKLYLHGLWRSPLPAPRTLNNRPKSESEVAQSCPTLCDSMDCSLPGFPIHGIFQARVLEWVAIAFFRGSSWLRDWTQVSCIIGRCFTIWATREVTWRITDYCYQQPTTHFYPVLLHRYLERKAKSSLWGVNKDWGHRGEDSA